MLSGLVSGTKVKYKKDNEGCNTITWPLCLPHKSVRSMIDSSCHLLDFVQRNGVAVGRWGMMYLFHIPTHHREDSMLRYFGSNAPYYHLTYRAYAPFLGLTKHPRPQVNEKPGSCSGILLVNFRWTVKWFVVSCRAKGKCQLKIQGTSFVGTVFHRWSPKNAHRSWVSHRWIYRWYMLEEIPNNHLRCIKTS